MRRNLGIFLALLAVLLGGASGAKGTASAKSGNRPLFAGDVK